MGRVIAAKLAADGSAVDALTRILAKELRGRDITVNAVAPGPTATGAFLASTPAEEHPEYAAEVIAAAGQAGGRAVGVEADVAHTEDLHRVIQTAVENFGRLDVLVSNAGIETRTSLLETSEADFDKVLAVNLKSAFFGAQFAAQQFMAQGSGGLIVTISSTHEDWPMPGNIAYCVSKSGTARFGTDPSASVLDVHCRAHDLDNLYVMDGSFMPSIGAVNPTLTIIANALRVGDHIAERLGTTVDPMRGLS